MSGSGGGGYIPPQSVKFDCESGIIYTAISSIDLDVLVTQRVEDILDIKLSEHETVILINRSGEILGSIVHRNTPELIECIKKKNQYQATITSIKNPMCSVKIERI
jgi:transcriptional regulator CtsR